MKREAAQTIWRTVVFAGAMLGTPACGKKPAPHTPANTTTNETKPEDTSATPDTTPEDEDSASRPRGTDDDGGGGEGRGFILS